MPTETLDTRSRPLGLRRAILRHPLVTLLVGIAALVLLGAFAYEPSVSAEPVSVPEAAEGAADAHHVFRFETLGSEELLTRELRLHRAFPYTRPQSLLDAGLRIDSEALPPALAREIAAGDFDWDDPANTVELLRAGAVVGVVARVEGDSVDRVGVSCALCHASVDDSVASGVGRRVDGALNAELDLAAFLGLSVDRAALAAAYEVEQGELTRAIGDREPGATAPAEAIGAHAAPLPFAPSADERVALARVTGAF